MGQDPSIRPRFWQWPYWDKESLYAIARKSLGAQTLLKGRVYYDVFQNALFSYDDSTYTTQNRPSAFQSYYDDYSVGGNLELETRLIPRNNLKLAVYYKHDTHRENNAASRYVPWPITPFQWRWKMLLR
ncbi:MAG: hypothetical protein HC880_21235 [Bacteroidia bacterium]|nr:hypothetical protein [Bacteroidia bacterium]